MYASVTARFFALFTSVVLLFNSISIGSPKDKIKIEYNFSNDIQGSAAGTVTLTSTRDGEYDLYWGNDDDKKLTFEVGKYDVTYSEFATVDIDNGTGSVEIQEFTAIPEDAESVLVYKNNILKAKQELPETKTTDNGEILYRFGALSDVHFNRYYKSLIDDSLVTFPNALQFFDKCGVNLVAMSGDLSSKGEASAFKKFNKCASMVNYPVLTCTGNHDVHSESDSEAWFKYINTGVYGGTKLQGVEVAPDGIDFVYAPDAANGDVFIFLSQYTWDYNHETSRILKDEQLDWLGEKLEQYKNTTVYLFFHTFVQNCDENGNKNMGEGNLENKNGVYYDLIYTPGAADEVRFRDYLKEYKNVIYFNGHSHWAYEMQKYNPSLNITDYNGTYATMVHLSSVSSPRIIKSENAKKKTEQNLIRSEGTLVTVYENRIVLNSIDFLKGKMLAYATYNIDF